MRRAAVVVCVGAALAGCGGEPPAPRPPLDTRTPAEMPPRPDDPGALQLLRFLGADRLAVLGQAATVESYRLDPAATPAPGAATFQGWTIARRGPDLTPDQGQGLRRRVLDAGSYVFGSAKTCAFQPGLGLRFRQGARVVDVACCFACTEWAFAMEGAATVTEDCDPVRAWLVALAQACFPDDAALGALRGDG